VLVMGERLGVVFLAAAAGPALEALAALMASSMVFAASCAGYSPPTYSA